MKLVETIIAKPILEETNREKLPDRVLCRVTYPICNIDELNANKRMYEDAVWDKVMKEKDLKEKLEKRALFGHAEHPEQTQSDLEKTSHVIFEMWKDNGVMYQKMDILDTPCGRIVDAILGANCQVGVSTRAEGDLEEAEDDEGNTYHRVVPESYKYVTTDFTADPSTFGAIPIDVRRNVVNTVAKEAINKEAKKEEREFARLILESMKCKKALIAKCKKCGCCKALKVVEGTWSYPYTEAKAKEVADLMKESLAPEGADKKLYNLLGSDTLFDAINKAEESKVTDIRLDIKNHITQMLEMYHKDPGSFKYGFEPKALEILHSIVDEGVPEVNKENKKMIKDIFTEGIIKVGTKVKYNNQKMEVTNIEKVDEMVSSITIAPDVEGKEVRVENDAVRIDGNPYISIEADGTITIMPVQLPPVEVPKTQVTTIPVTEPGNTGMGMSTVSSEEELEVPKEEIPESRIPVEGGLTNKIALGNMLRDKENKYWIVREVRGTGLLVSSFEGPPGDQKFVEWDKVGDLGFVKVGEKKEVSEKFTTKDAARVMSKRYHLNAAIAMETAKQIMGDFTPRELATMTEEKLSAHLDELEAMGELPEGKVDETIKKKKDGWHVYSKKGKHLGGPYGTKKEAQKQLADVEKFRHVKSESVGELRYTVKKNSEKGWDIWDTQRNEKVETWETEGHAKDIADGMNEDTLPSESSGLLEEFYTFMDKKDFPDWDEGLKLFAEHKKVDVNILTEQFTELFPEGDIISENWKDLPKGWTRKSLKSFARSLLGKWKPKANESKEIIEKKKWFHVICPCETDLEVEEEGTVTCHNCGRVLDGKGRVLEGPDEVNEGFRTDLKNKDKKAILQKMDIITDKLLKGEKISDSEKTYWDAYHAEVSKNESIEVSISTTTKEIKDLRVKEASTRAERDKALELLEELTSKSGKQESLESKMLINKIKRIVETKDIEVDALRAKLEEKAKLVSELREKVVVVERKLTTVKVNLVTDIRKLEETVMAAEEKHQNEVTRLKDEYNKEVEQLKQQHNENIKQMEDNFNKEVKEEVAKAREESKSNFIKYFTMLRLEESGLSVDDNSRALLEKCESLEGVDDLLEEILDTSRRSALHSEVVKGVKISRPPMDPEQAEADRQVGNVFKGMNGR